MRHGSITLNFSIGMLVEKKIQQRYDECELEYAEEYRDQCERKERYYKMPEWFRKF